MFYLVFCYFSLPCALFYCDKFLSIRCNIVVEYHIGAQLLLTLVSVSSKRLIKVVLVHFSIVIVVCLFDVTLLSNITLAHSWYRHWYRCLQHQPVALEVRNRGEKCDSMNHICLPRTRSRFNTVTKELRVGRYDGTTIGRLHGKLGFQVYSKLGPVLFTMYASSFCSNFFFLGYGLMPPHLNNINKVHVYGFTKLCTAYCVTVL